MKIGAPKETAARERRVALVPDVVRRLRAAEHEVIVESGAGLRAGATDEQYVTAGAEIGDPWSADVVAKVGDPAYQAGMILAGFLPRIAMSTKFTCSATAPSASRSAVNRGSITATITG